jgi:hypothetical protein
VADEATLVEIDENLAMLCESRPQCDDAKPQIVLRRGEPLLPGFGAPEQTRVGVQKAFEHSDLARPAQT